ncbi:MAG: hypothetical protein ACOY58_05735, partial [Candidatus Micrarchaeota archaeon]
STTRSPGMVSAQGEQGNCSRNHIWDCQEVIMANAENSLLVRLQHRSLKGAPLNEKVGVDEEAGLA